MEEELGDFQAPRENGRLTKTIRRLMIGYGILFWLFLIQCSCSPIVTSPHGYVINMDSLQLAVEHERMDKPGYGIVRYYKFPFGHDYAVGDSIYVGTKEY